MAKIPKAKAPSQPIPKAQANTENKKWNFSFRYWTQIEHFGLSTPNVNNSWFTSLIDRFKELGDTPIEKMMANRQQKNYLKFHKIDWNLKNVPITLEDFYKIVPKEHIPEEQDICQFMISKGKGRVVGFFDHNEIFQIVLLDPEHNIQPAKDYNYSVDPTQVTLTENGKLIETIKNLKRHADKSCGTSSCNFKQKIGDLLEHGENTRLICLNEFLGETEIQLLIEEFGSIDDIIYHSLTLLTEKKDNEQLS